MLCVIICIPLVKQHTLPTFLHLNYLFNDSFLNENVLLFFLVLPGTSMWGFYLEEHASILYIFKICFNTHSPLCWWSYIIKIYSRLYDAFILINSNKKQTKQTEQTKPTDTHTNYIHPHIQREREGERERAWLYSLLSEQSTISRTHVDMYTRTVTGMQKEQQWQEENVLWYKKEKKNKNKKGEKKEKKKERRSWTWRKKKW